MTCRASRLACNLLLSLLLVSGAGGAASSVTAPAPVTSGRDGALPEAPTLLIETLATGLDHPWSIAFLPDGRELVTERAGQLRLIENGALSSALEGVPEVFAEGQGGLFDVRVHPDFARNAWIYLSYAHGSAARNATRVARARLDGHALVDLEVLFTASPFKDTPVHYGGRMAFLPDGTLLVTIGDGFDFREAAQRLDSHLGKIVRLNADGSVPADNPFTGRAGVLGEIFSLGHRNPQGLAFDPASGEVFSHEHGPAGGDEINRIVAGGNYGWPIATHGRDYSGAAISPFESRPGLIDPLLHWTPSIAPGGLTLVGGPLFPSLTGELLVAALKTRDVRRVRLNAQFDVTDEASWCEVARRSSCDGACNGACKAVLDGAERLRDVSVAPDGSLRLLTDSSAGRVLRLTPAAD